MREATKKATFNLPLSVLAELDDAVEAHAATSKNALVQRALVRELREVRRQVRGERWTAGARDSLLLQDIQDTETAFRAADGETAGSGD